MLIHEFWALVAEYRRENPTQRIGQAMSNVAFMTFGVNSSNCLFDPFHNDAYTAKFQDYLVNLQVIGYSA